MVQCTAKFIGATARRLGGERTDEGGLEGVADVLVGLDSAGADEGANLLPLLEVRVDDDDREPEDNRKERQCLSREGSGNTRQRHECLTGGPSRSWSRRLG